MDVDLAYFLRYLPGLDAMGNILLTLTARSLMLLLGGFPLLDCASGCSICFGATEMSYRVFLAIAFPRASKLITTDD